MSAVATRGLGLAVSVALAALFGVACEASPGDPAAAAASATADKSGNCASCHMAEFEAVTHPVHVGAKPTKCGVCHVEEGWHPSTLNHAWWPLTGAHEKAECSYCHKGTPTVFRGAPKECVGCHREDYDASTYPGHQTFSTKCTDCHGTTGWKPSKYVPPPPPPPPVATVAPLGATIPKGKLPPGVRPPPTTTPTTPRVPPTVPTTRPPPDVTSRPSPRR